jgi:hypothetical protein
MNRPGAAWRNDAVDELPLTVVANGRKEEGLPSAIARRERDVSVEDAYRQPSLGALRRLAGDRDRGSCGVINRMAGLARPQSVRIA